MSASLNPGEKQFLQWFKSHGWTPFRFQREAWRADLCGHSGLIHSPTGTGKTYAVAIPPLIDWLNENPKAPAWPKILESPFARKVLATVHPSSLLRQPDAESQARQYGLFVSDLRVALEAAGSVNA